MNKDFYHGFRKSFIKDSTIPQEARFLMVLLFCYKGKNPSCWPSQGELAKRMGRSRDTIRKYLRILQRRGFLKATQQGIGHSLNYFPSYITVTAPNENAHAEMPRPQPAQSFRALSIDSENKDRGLIKIGNTLIRGTRTSYKEKEGVC